MSIRSNAVKSSDPLFDRYFLEFRSLLYVRHSEHMQYGSRSGRSLAEHLDSVCQFVLTIGAMAGFPPDLRAALLAAALIHDLNKLDEAGRSVKTLARNQQFLHNQLESAGAISLISSQHDLELVRRLIERHSGHHVTDGMAFFPEDPLIGRAAAVLVAADLLDLNLDPGERQNLLEKIARKLAVALDRPSCLFEVHLTENYGHLTSLLLGACEEVLIEKGLSPISVIPSGILFEGLSWPTDEDLVTQVAIRWRRRIDAVFGDSIEQLVQATTDGIKVSARAVAQDRERALECVFALLEKKRASYKQDKVNTDLAKHAQKAGQALETAQSLGLRGVSSADAFAVAEGCKAAYLSFRVAGLSTQEAWDQIAQYADLSKEQRSALEAFDPQYGRPLFIAEAMGNTGLEAVRGALVASFDARIQTKSVEEGDATNEADVAAVMKLLNWPVSERFQGRAELEAYVQANPRERCSFGSACAETKALLSDELPAGTKVQVFSNRLPGGSAAEPKRRGNTLVGLAYQLVTVGSNLPKVDPKNPIFLHLALPTGASPALLRIWREKLREMAAINTEGGPVNVDILKLYREHALEFRSHTVLGMALPKHQEFVHSSFMVPLAWGDANATVSLLKSARLALELSFGLGWYFPFVLGSDLSVEQSGDFGRIEGVPAAVTPLFGTGRYNTSQAYTLLKHLRCLGDLTVVVADLDKFDDTLAELARGLTRPLDLYYILLRRLLRKEESPDLAYYWGRISEPLKTLLEDYMDEKPLRDYLKEAAALAAAGRLWGSSYKRTAMAEPFAEFISAIRKLKPRMDYDTLFAALVTDYHTRLDRIREHGVGRPKFEQITAYYSVLRRMFEQVYSGKPERLLADQKTLQSAYLFFLEEARAELKSKEAETPVEDIEPASSVAQS